MKPKLLIVVNVDWFFVSHRLPIAIAARDAGYEVHLATRRTDMSFDFEGMGLIVHDLPIERGRSGFAQLLKEFRVIHAVLRKLRPDIVHLVTIKPVLLGGLASRMTRTTGVLSAISGLGTVFTAAGARARIRRALVRLVYSVALGHPNIRVVVQNDDDRKAVLAMSRVAETDIRIVPGSGVDTDLFRPGRRSASEANASSVVMFAARLLRDKGIIEFYEAAKRLGVKEFGSRRPRFVIVGSIDPDNHTSITSDELEEIRRSGACEIWGPRTDMADTLRQADIVVLPSYREGMPKVLLEAAACGKPIVTCDVPGCREAVVPGETGILVKPRDSDALAEGIETLLQDADRRARMGDAGRALALKRFQVSAVVDAHLKLYRELVPES